MSLSSLHQFSRWPGPLRAVAVTATLLLFASSCGADESATAVAESADAAEVSDASEVEPTDDAMGDEPQPSSVDDTAEPEIVAADPDRLRAVDGSFPPAPEVPDGPLDPEVVKILDGLFAFEDGSEFAGIEELSAYSGDPRLGWLWTDLLRFTRPGDLRDYELVGFANATGLEPNPFDAWKSATDHLIAWDIPAPPGYQEYKRRLFTSIEPGWEPFFADTDSDIDWRILSWGGVLIDDRPVSETNEPCPDGCIPAIDDPAVTDAAGGDWYDDDRIVFGVVINDEARAYPKNLMEIHEMVNDELGGRRIGMPYCTLCGAAQAFLTDDVDDGFESELDRYELRTSGLLSRSNKVMYELQSKSVFDTFTGVALSGPLQDLGVELEQVAVITTTWGEWKAEYPDTTILSQLNPWGWPYADDPLNGRDDNGPIFPIGDVDPRLPIQESIVGVMTADGWVAFPAALAKETLDAGGAVEAAEISLREEAGGLVAWDADGNRVASHQAFWFAWSQFHPDTELWNG